MPSKFSIIEIKEGDNEKVAFIGRKMANGVNDAATHLKKYIGKEGVETFQWTEEAGEDGF